MSIAPGYVPETKAEEKLKKIQIELDKAEAGRYSRIMRTKVREILEEQ